MNQSNLISRRCPDRSVEQRQKFIPSKSVLNSPNDEYGMEPPIEEEYHALNLIDVEEIKIYQPNQSLEKSKGHTIWQDLKSSQARLNTLKASQGRLNEIFQLLKGIFRGPNDEQSYKAAPFSGQKKVIQSNLISRYRPDLSAERRQKFNPSKFVLNSPSNRYGLKSPIEEEYHAPNLINKEEREIYQPNQSPAKLKDLEENRECASKTAPKEEKKKEKKSGRIKIYQPKSRQNQRI